MRCSLSRYYIVAITLLMVVVGGCVDEPAPNSWDALDAPMGSEEPALPARQHFIATQQADAGPGYAVQPRVGLETGFIAHHSAWAMRTELVRAGVHIEHDGDALTLTLVNWGREGARVPAGEVEPTAERNRVEYDRGELSEWYVNGPLGLQQGFTLRSRPPGSGQLEIVMRVSGDFEAELNAHATAVLFHGAQEAVRLHYSDLYVNDATGRPLEAVLALDGDSLTIEIDDTAATYPVTVDPLFGLETKLTPAPPVGDERFGASIFVEGDMAVIGATYSDAPQSNAGAAYVYTRSAGVWSPEEVLRVPGASQSDVLGTDVSFSGDTVIVGGSSVWTAPAGQTGAAYVFIRRSDGMWSLQQRLTPSSGWASGDEVGYAVAIDGDTAVVGAPGRDDDGSQSGAAFVFTRSGTVWTQQQRLIPSFAFQNMRYGTDVAIENGTIIVGASGNDEFGTDAGAAYVFVLLAGVWTEQQKLYALDATSRDYFGEALALEGDTVVLGAYGDDDQGDVSGSVYVFQRTNDAWTQTQKLVGSTAGVEDRFGSSLDFEGSVMVVGAYNDYDTRLRGTTGTAYVFEKVANSWTETLQLFASDRGPDDQYGYRVAVTGNTVFCGAHLDDDIATNSGAMYVYDLVTISGLCSLSQDCATGYCVDGVCCDDACGDGATDDCQACSVAAGGVTDGLCGPLGAAAGNTVCRPSMGVCDVEETCEAGLLDCPVDEVAAAMTECREATLECDVAEACDGLSPYCGTDGFVAFGTVCRASLGSCDPAEACSGLDPECPADLLSEQGTECREAAGPCDVAENCTGASVECPGDTLKAAGTACRPAGPVCDATEMCDGVGTDCPTDISLPDEASCEDGFVCNGAEACIAGACMLGPFPECDDEDACTFDMCVEPSGCTHSPIDGCCNEDVDCDDGDSCTRDVCSGLGGTCQSVPLESCCWNDADCNDHNYCTLDRCMNGVCTNGLLPGCCAADADCDDMDPCTENSCVGLRCVSTLSPTCGEDVGSPDASSSDASSNDGPVEEPNADTSKSDSETNDSNDSDIGSGATPTPPPSDGCGCRVGKANSDGHGGLALLILMAAGFVRLRRRRHSLSGQ